jgi:RHS repeat-associated protein
MKRRTVRYLTDHEGSVHDIANTSGTVLDHVTYDSYGDVTSESSPSSGDRFKFDGMAWDAAIGLYYDNARYFDPTSGEFVSQDPTGFSAADANLYRFIGDGPTDGIDPTGLQKAPGMAQKKPIRPTSATVVGISTGVIDQLQNGTGSNGPVTLPGGGTTLAGAPNTYQGPCALYAKDMTTALDAAKIPYTLHFYKVASFATVNPTVQYKPPKGPPQTVTVKSTIHVIVEVATDSGTLLFDAGVGLDPIYNSNGNFGDGTTGVITPGNQNPVITGPPGQNPKVMNQPLLKEQFY